MTSIDDCHPVVWRGISSHEAFVLSSSATMWPELQARGGDAPVVRQQFFDDGLVCLDPTFNQEVSLFTAMFVDNREIVLLFTKSSQFNLYKRILRIMNSPPTMGRHVKGVQNRPL